MDHWNKREQPSLWSLLFTREGLGKAGPLQGDTGKCLPKSMCFLTVKTGPAWNQSGDFWKWWQWSHRCQELVTREAQWQAVGTAPPPPSSATPRHSLGKTMDFLWKHPMANFLAGWSDHTFALSSSSCHSVIHLLYRPLPLVSLC